MMEIGFLIPIVIVALPFIFTLVIILIKGVENKNKVKYKADLYAKALEKGEKLPEHIFDDSKKKTSALEPGIILISIGIGLAIFLGVALDSQEKLRGAMIGVIPFSLGVGFLIIYFVSNNKNKFESEK